LAIKRIGDCGLAIDGLSIDGVPISNQLSNQQSAIRLIANLQSPIANLER